MDDLSHVPNQAEIEISQEGMVTTPVEGVEGPIRVEDGEDKDPVVPKE